MKSCGQAPMELEPEPVTTCHSSNRWPFHIHRRATRNDIVRITDQSLHEKGVTVDWRVLTIQGEDVLQKCVKSYMDKHKYAPQTDQLTTVLISPQQ